MSKKSRLQQLIELIDQNQTQYQDYKNERDEEIRKEIRDGKSMYALAKETGLSDTYIRKVRDATKDAP